MYVGSVARHTFALSLCFMPSLYPLTSSLPTFVPGAAPEDIHAGKEGPVLELFWQIIRRYQLQWGPCGIPDKLALYTWFGERMPHHKINNFDSG